MLTADQLDSLTDPITDLFAEFELSILRDIARRLSKLAIPSAAWQVQRLTEAGSVYRDILKKLSRLTGVSETELNKVFQEAGAKTIKFDDAIYKRIGLQSLPFSPAMAQTLLAGLEKTKGILKNLTLTTALSGQQLFIHAADLAHLQVTTGTMSYNQAIRQAIKNVGDSGLEIIYPTGHRDKLDVAMRRTVLTGVAQTAAQVQIARANEMQQDLVAVSSHVGARNKGVGPMNHESWQGQIYSRSGTHERYKPFVETTGFGTGEGLAGYNCRHGFAPWFEDLSADPERVEEKTVKLGDREIDYYEATQMQRAIERKIREWKRREAVLEAAGLEHTRESAKVREWQARMRAFVSQTGLVRQREREQVI